MRACWLKWVGRDWSISADYIWLNYSDANKNENQGKKEGLSANEEQLNKLVDNCMKADILQLIR